MKHNFACIRHIDVLVVYTGAGYCRTFPNTEDGRNAAASYYVNYKVSTDRRLKSHSSITSTYHRKLGNVLKKFSCALDNGYLISEGPAPPKKYKWKLLKHK